MYWLYASVLCSSTVVAQQSSDVQSVLSMKLKEHIEKHKLIGLGGAVIQNGRVIARAAAGLRQKSGNDPMQGDDKFHIGSVGKIMTTLVTMRLVERQLLDLASPISTYLPNYEIHKSWSDVTLSQLLVHTAGAPRDFPGPLFENNRMPLNIVAKDREEAVRLILKNETVSSPGEAHLYSNVGFTLIGHVAEVVLSKPWEIVIREEIWKPLNLTSAGFGPPKSDINLDGSQPWGHRPIFYHGELWGIPSIGPMREQDPSKPSSDLPTINTPAGLVHMNMEDLARLGYEFLAGQRGESDLLSMESFEFLLAANQNISGGLKYANGALVLDEIGLLDTKDSSRYWSVGWNTTFVGFIALLPEQNAVVSLSANDGRHSKVRRAFFKITNAVSMTLP